MSLYPDIHDNSEDKSSALDRLNKKNPFIVPDQYFEELPGKIMSSIESLPDFESVSKVNPFTVPDGYFEQLPSVIQDRLHDQTVYPNPVSIWIQSWLRPKWSLSLAAVILVLFFSIRFFNHQIKIDVPEHQLCADDVENSGYISDVDESMLIEELDQQISFNLPAKENDNLIQYLLDNDIDVNLIENKL